MKSPFFSSQALRSRAKKSNPLSNQWWRPAPSISKITTVVPFYAVGRCIRRSLAAIIFLGTGLVSQKLRAQTTLYWVNSGTGNWDTTGAANWSDTPTGPATFNWTQNDNVEIVAANPTLNITAAGTLQVTDFRVDNGAAITQTSGARTFSINGAGSGDFSLINFADSYSTPLKVILNGTSAYNGRITVSGSDASSSVVIGSTTATGIETKVVLNSPLAALTLDAPLVNHTVTIGELSGVAGEITASYGPTGGTKTLNVNQSSDTTFAGTLARGNGRKLAFTKSGTGSLALKAINTNQGATVVSGGVLRFDASDVSAVTTVGTRTASSRTVTGIDTTGLAVGMEVDTSSPGYANGAVIVAINGNTITLDAAASSAGTDPLVFKAGSGISVNSTLQINGGVVGLGGGDFTRSLGTAVNQVQWTGSGGFAAYTEDRVVNLGGASAGVIWGSGNFVSNTSTLILGARDADHTVDFQNGIELNGASRTVQVDHGAAAIDAKLSGDISGTGTSGLTKTGAGILVLSGSNSYSGATLVSAGTLLIDGDQSAATGAVSVSNGAAVGGSGTSGGALTITSGGVLEPGTNTAGNLTVASLILNPGAVANFEIDGTDTGSFDTISTTGGEGAITLNGTLNLIISITLSDNASIDLFLGTALNTGNFSNVNLMGGGYTPGTFSNGGSGTLWTLTQGAQTLTFDASTGVLSSVPEPTVGVLIGVGLGVVFFFRRRSS